MIAFGAGHAQRCRRETTSLQDLGAGALGPMTPGGSGDWRDAAFGAGKRYGAYVSMIPGAGQVWAAASLTFGVAESSLQATREAQVKGTTVFGVARDLVPTPSEEASRGHGRIKCRSGNCSVIYFQRQSSANKPPPPPTHWTESAESPTCQRCRAHANVGRRRTRMIPGSQAISWGGLYFWQVGRRCSRPLRP